MRIDAAGMHYRELNERIHEALAGGAEEIVLDNVNGQRYIGDGLGNPVKIVVNGVPGNDLGAFMDGAIIIVNSNAQDAIGNTMNAGTIVVHGNAGDIVGHSMRGGEILVKGDVGYRVGIHMKSYRDLYPVLIIGGAARDFLGEYMAGGMVVILGLGVQPGRPLAGKHCATGMHGGVIYVRGDVPDEHLASGVAKQRVSPEDLKALQEPLGRFCGAFDVDADDVMSGNFIKLVPQSLRPYGKVYAY